MSRLERLAIAVILAYHAGSALAELYCRLFHIRSIHV